MSETVQPREKPPVDAPITSRRLMMQGIHDALVTARTLGQISLDRVPTTTQRKGYVVRVAPIMNAHVNYDKLAFALLEQVRLMREGKARAEEPESSS